jgi:hypothetical protein
VPHTGSRCARAPAPSRRTSPRFIDGRAHSAWHRRWAGHARQPPRRTSIRRTARRVRPADQSVLSGPEAEGKPRLRGTCGKGGSWQRERSGSSMPFLFRATPQYGHRK